MSKYIYVVGDKNAPKTNQWDAMTNNEAEANRLVSEGVEGTVMKRVTVNKPFKKKELLFCLTPLVLVKYYSTLRKAN